MPYKDPEKRKAYHRAYNKTHYHANKEYYRIKNKKAKDSLKARFNELKSSLSCIHCGEDDNVVLDFHHREGTIKEFGISEGLRRYSWQRVLDEIEKCDVLCANCHRRHHHG